MTDNMTDDTLLLDEETETADANPAGRQPRKQVTRDESTDTESAFDRLMRSLRADLEHEDVDETDNLLIEWDDVDDPFHDINDDDIEASLSNLNLAIDMDDRTLKQAPPFSNLHDEVQDTILRNRAEQGEALSLNPLGIEKPDHHLNQIGHMLQSGQVQIRRTAIGALPLILPEPAGTSAGLSNLYDAAALSTPRGKLQTKPSAQAISKALLEEQPPIALPDIEVIAEPEIEAEIEAVAEVEEAEAETPVVIEAEVEPVEAAITDETEVEEDTAEAAETAEQAQQPSWMIPPADMAEQVQAEPVEEPVKDIAEEAVREEVESADEAVAKPPFAPKLNLKPAVDPVEALQPSAKELRRQEKQKAKELAREQAERRKEEKQAEKLAALQAKAEAKQAKADAVARVRAAKAANANNRSATAATPAQKSSKAGPIAVAACLTLMVGAGVTLIVFNEHPHVRKLAEQLNALRPAPKPASTAPDSSAAQIPNLNMATTAPTPDAVVATEPPPMDAEELAALAEQPPAIPAAPAVAAAPPPPTAPAPVAETPTETAEEEPPVPAEETQVAAIPTVNAAEAPAATEAKPQRLTAPAPIPLPAELEALRESAVAGNRQAQHDLGAHFAAGRLVTQDFARAAYWFQEAAIRGVANAQYNFGVLLQQGLGVDPNPELAVQWYRRAAENGHVEAQYNMGVAYADGIGTQRDIAQAVRWFEQSAAAGIARAAFNLGVMYEVGMLGSRDIDAARQWYRQAATSGDQDATKALDRLNSQSN